MLCRHSSSSELCCPHSGLFTVPPVSACKSGVIWLASVFVCLFVLCLFLVVVFCQAPPITPHSLSLNKFPNNKLFIHCGVGSTSLLVSVSSFCKPLPNCYSLSGELILLPCEFSQVGQGSWEKGPRRSPDLQEMDLLSPSGLWLSLFHSYHRLLRDRFRMVPVPASGHCLLIPISQRGAPPPQSKGLACAISGLSGTLLTADSCFQSDSDVKLFPRPLTQFLWARSLPHHLSSQALPVPCPKSALWSVA